MYLEFVSKFAYLGESSPCNCGFTDKIIIELSCDQGYKRKVWSEEETYDWADSVKSYFKSSSGRVKGEVQLLQSVHDLKREISATVQIEYKRGKLDRGGLSLPVKFSKTQNKY